MGASAGRIPTNAGRHGVFASVPPARFRAELRGDRLAALQRLLAEVSTALADEVAATQPDGELHAFGNRRPAPMVSIGCHAS